MNDAITIESAELRAAIDRYFQVKAENNGFFKDDAIKTEVCGAVMRAANAVGLTTIILPGHIYLTADDTVFSFTVSRPQGYLDIELTKALRERTA